MYKTTYLQLTNMYTSRINKLLTHASIITSTVVGVLILTHITLGTFNLIFKRGHAMRSQQRI